ncbi:MAG: thrombospondin type 3 repeat-containing protein [Limisphaerales bacterium]|jgi:hypothetical protein|nr:thrombospondin type 3 repeat-containing protein [Verrucomicrobiota bacterium]
MLAMKKAGKNWAMLLLGSLAFSGIVFCATAQVTESGALGRDGTEFLATSTGRLPGEQTHPSLALGGQGGFLVWEDNVSDLDGLGVSAQRLDASLQPVGGEFRVNEIGKADQEAPVAAMLSGGQALFAWQSGVRGIQKVAYRLLDENGLFGAEQSLSQEGLYQKEVQVAALTDGTAVILWSSADASGKPMGVYMQRVSASGEKLGGIQAVSSALGNRSGSIAALSDGGFAVAWLKESLSTELNPDGSYKSAQLDAGVKVQLFGNDLGALGGVSTVSPVGEIVSNPTIAAGPYGMAVAWSVVVLSEKSQTWDVGGAVLDLTGKPVKSLPVINTYLPGDQFLPQLAACQENYFAVWTSLRQDGSFEGVFGRLFNASGFVSNEVQVNTTSFLNQIHPTVAASERGFMVCWSSYLLGDASFDLMAQRYLCDSDGIVLDQPEAPFAYGLTEYEIFVSWPAVAGRAVKEYQLFIDGAPALSLSEPFYTLEDLSPGSSRSFSYRYVLESGVVSPVSKITTAKTWGADKNRDGLPDDWQALYFGSDKDKWPSAWEDSDGDGVSNLDEFLAGTDPTDPESALKTSLKVTAQGVRLEWGTVPGFVYQVQSSEGMQEWANLGVPRRATAGKDSIALEPDKKRFFRIVRVSR